MPECNTPILYHIRLSVQSYISRIEAVRLSDYFPTYSSTFLRTDIGAHMYSCVVYKYMVNGSERDGSSEAEGIRKEKCFVKLFLRFYTV